MLLNSNEYINIQIVIIVIIVLGFVFIKKKSTHSVSTLLGIF